MNIESLAVSAVNSALGTADYLKSFINEGKKVVTAEIDKNNPDHKRIYYNPLLPYDLNEIINGKEDQKKHIFLIMIFIFTTIPTLLGI